jgi:transposase-like protein
MSDKNNGPYKGEGETVWASDDENDTTQIEEPKYRNEDWLRHQYIDLGKSMNAIAEEFGYGSTTISEWVDKHGIEKRRFGEQISKSKREGKIYHNKDWLATQYNGLKLTLIEMAEKAGASRMAIVRAMNQHGIERRGSAQINEREGPWDNKEWLRNQYIEQEKSAPDIAEEFDVSTSLIYDRLEKFDFGRRNSGSKGKGWMDERKYTDEEWLCKQYVSKKRSAPDIASECGVSDDTILRWLKKFGVEVRDAKEYTKQMWYEKKKTKRNRDMEDGVSSDDGDIVLNMAFQDSSPGVDYWVPYRDAEYMRKEYNQKEKTVKEIANQIGVTAQTVLDWMDRHGIERRQGGHQ